MFDPDDLVNTQVKKILNSNIDTTNIIGFNDWLSLSIQTLRTIISNVQYTYGKNALNHLVIYNNLRSIPVFTNDGIHILKSIEFCSPAQEYIANNIRYIGERVEHAAGDGTSTAILVASNILLNIYQNYIIELLEHQNADDKPFNYIQQYIKKVEEGFNNIIDNLLVGLEDYKINLSDMDDRSYRNFIRSLAYTTSKGNKVLSDMVVELFSNRNIPMEEFSGFTFIRSHSEKAPDFEIVYNDFDITVNVSENKSAYYNDKLGTAIDHEHANLIIIPETIDDNRDKDLITDLIEYMEDPINQNIPVVILSNGQNVPLQTELLRKLKDNIIVFCQYMNNNVDFKVNPIELKVILYTNGKKGYFTHNKNLEDSIFKDVYIHIESGKLQVKLNGKDGKPLIDPNSVHPGYNDPDYFREYTQLLNAIYFELNNKRNSHVIDMTVNQLISEYTRLYMYMICPHQPILKVGGKTTDHLANLNVVEDVLGTITHSLSGGVIFDGLLKLLLLSMDEHDKNKNTATDIIKSTFLYLFDITHIKEIFEYCGSINSSCFENIEIFRRNDINIKKYSYVEYGNKGISIFNTETGMIDELDPITSKSYTNDNAPFKNIFLIQAFESFKELLIRLKEVLPRLITTVNVIVPGEVNLKKE